MRGPQGAMDAFSGFGLHDGCRCPTHGPHRDAGLGRRPRMSVRWSGRASLVSSHLGFSNPERPGPPASILVRLPPPATDWTGSSAPAMRATLGQQVPGGASSPPALGALQGWRPEKPVRLRGAANDGGWLATAAITTGMVSGSAGLGGERPAGAWPARSRITSTSRPRKLAGRAPGSSRWRPSGRSDIRKLSGSGPRT